MKIRNRLADAQTRFAQAACRITLLLAVAVCSCTMLSAQSSSSGWLQPIAAFPLSDDPITLRRHVESEKPFTVAGECGALLGQQNGSFEAWIFPVKLFSHLTIQAHVDGYDVPIDVNRDAAEIEVAPDHTTITYSHIAFTLKEILFASQCGASEGATQDGAGVMAIFRVQAIRPLTLTFSFTPEMKPMWPAPISASVDPEWVKLDPGDGAPMNDTTRPGGTGAQYSAGWYMLHTDLAGLAGALAMPGAEPGIMAPYQEKPQTYPLQFILRIDPKRDSNSYFPLLMAAGTTAKDATKAALAEKLKLLHANTLSLYLQNAAYYAHFFDRRTSVETPDAAFDRDLRWAALAIDQVRVRHGDETGMVAGFYSSGSSARPGFGWFFGRDTLFTTWGINSYGDYQLTRQALTFLIRRQREDGKMPHEFSQTAEQVDWAHLPYEYAAADATPLFLMAVEDYIAASGDTQFLTVNWNAIAKAWQFETTHDTDGDGIYDNSQGTGWVESWPQGMPHQEIYLASLDQQASEAMALLSAQSRHADIAESARQRAAAIHTKLLAEYSQPDGMYAFSRNSDATADQTPSIYPAIAWWGGLASTSGLPKADAMFARWASHEFSTDWGTRDVSDRSDVYDPISYHQGSVWPLFTGWASLAEYRTGRELAGYTHLMQNTNLTTEQDLGAVTELLSGAFYDPFGRSTSHQMWSSAMVLAPAMRGLFGISIDAMDATIHVNPHLPAQWSTSTLHHVQVGSHDTGLRFERRGQELMVSLLNPDTPRLKLASDDTGVSVAKDGSSLRIPLPGIEVGMNQAADSTLPLPGAQTRKLKVLTEKRDTRSLTMQLEAEGGSTQSFIVRRNDEKLRPAVEGGRLVEADSMLIVKFPAGPGYQQQTVTLRW